MAEHAVLHREVDFQVLDFEDRHYSQGLKFGHELFKRQTCLLDDAFERSGFERFVLRDDNCPASLPQNEMRAGLPKGNEAERVLTRAPPRCR